MKLRRNPITMIYSSIFVLVMALALMNLAVLTYDKFSVDGLENVISVIVLVLILLFFIGAFFIKDGEKLKGLEKKSSALTVTELLISVASAGFSFFICYGTDIVNGIYAGLFVLLVYAVTRLIGGRLCSMVGSVSACVSIYFYYEVGRSVFVTDDFIDVFCILVPFLLVIFFVKHLVNRFSKKGAILVCFELLLGMIFGYSINTNPLVIWLVIGLFLALVFSRGKEAYNTMTKGIVVGGLILLFSAIAAIVFPIITGGDIGSIVSFEFAQGFSESLGDGSVMSYCFEKLSDELLAYVIAPYPYGIFPTILALFAAIGGVYTAIKRSSYAAGFELCLIGTAFWFITCAPDASHNHYYLLLIPVFAAYGFSNSLIPEKFSESEDEEEEENAAGDETVNDLEPEKKQGSKSTPSKEDLARRADELLSGKSESKGPVDDLGNAEKNAAVEALKAELDRRERERNADTLESEQKRSIEELSQSLADVAAESSSSRPGYSATVPLQRNIEKTAPKVEKTSTDTETANATADDKSAGIKDKDESVGSAAAAKTDKTDSHFMEWHVSEEFVRDEEIKAIKAAKKAEEEAALADEKNTSVDLADEGEISSDLADEGEISSDLADEEKASNVEIAPAVEGVFYNDEDDEEQHSMLSSDAGNEELFEEEKNVTLDSTDIKFDGEEEKNVKLDPDVGYTDVPTDKIDPSDTSMIISVDEDNQPLADKRIPEEMTINAVNDGLEGAVHSSFTPEADSVLGGGARAKYESSEALLDGADIGLDPTSDDDQKEKVEELISAIEHTVVPSVDLPEISDLTDISYDDEGDDKDDDSDDSMMNIREALSDKESLANEGLKAVDDMSGRLSAAAMTLGAHTAGVMTKGEDEELDNLLDRLDMSEGIRRMTESAREDMADVIEQDADVDKEEESEVVLSNEDYDFGADDEYGEVPTVSDLEDRWRLEAEMADTKDADIPDVVAAGQIDETEIEVGIEPEEAAAEEPADAEGVEEEATAEEAADIVETEIDKEEPDNTEDIQFEDIQFENIDVEKTEPEIEDLEEIGIEEVEVEETAFEANAEFEEIQPMPETALETTAEATPEATAEPIEKPQEENPEIKRVEFNDLVKLVFEDDEELGIPKPDEESMEDLEARIYREKHRNLFDEKVHTKEVVKRTGSGSRSYHKIFIKKDE